MEDFLDDYVACPNCESPLLFDRERQLFLCPDCRGEFVAENGWACDFWRSSKIFSGIKKGFPADWPETPVLCVRMRGFEPPRP